MNQSIGTQERTSFEKTIITIFAVSLIIIGPISIDIYLPALPRIKIDFGDYAPFSIGFFTMGMGLGQVFFGPLSDKYGRKPVILMGLSLYAVGSLLIYGFAYHITTLLLFRLLQGLGASATLVCCIAMIRDSFTGVQLTQRYSIVSACLNVMPALAPSIGVFLLSFWEWHNLFLLLFAYSAILFTIFFFLFKETKQKTQTAFVTISWLNLLKYRTLVVYTTCCVCGFSMIMTYISTASHVLMDISKVDQKSFALYFAINSMITISGNLTCSRLVTFISSKKILLIGLCLWIIAGIFMLFWSGSTEVRHYLIPIGILSFGNPMVMGTSSSLAMRPFKQNAGRAAAFIGCSQTVLASIVSIIVNAIGGNIKTIFGIMLILFALLCFTVTRFDPKQVPVEGQIP